MRISPASPTTATAATTTTTTTATPHPAVTRNVADLIALVAPGQGSTMRLSASAKAGPGESVSRNDLMTATCVVLPYCRGYMPCIR